MTHTAGCYLYDPRAAIYCDGANIPVCVLNHFVRQDYRCAYREDSVPLNSRHASGYVKGPVAVEGQPAKHLPLGGAYYGTGIDDDDISAVCAIHKDVPLPFQYLPEFCCITEIKPAAVGLNINPLVTKHFQR